MTSPILTTKLFIPPLRSDLLPRPVLTGKLDESFAYPLTLVSAAAGFGKTTLLSEWASRARRPIAWLSLDAGDDDPVVFLSYLIAALRTIHESWGEAAMELLRAERAVPMETIVIDLINEMAASGSPFTLILDDFHEITGRRTNELMRFVADHLPPPMHLIVATRIDPPWPLARYRVRNRLLEIRGQDLRFSDDEATHFFNQVMGLHLDPEDVELLASRTEGWIAGLQLAALSMKGRQNAAGFVEDFGGSQLFVSEYLVEEVLRRQSQDVNEFLLQTSILARLNAQLCDAVTGRQDGRAKLIALHRANLLVSPLDAEGNWFRYHRLFADLLQARLHQTQPAADIYALHERAAAWYAQNGQVDEAVRHAMAAGAHDRVAALVEQEARPMMSTGRAGTLRRWLDGLPGASYQTHPRLHIYRLWIDLMQEKGDVSPSGLRAQEDLLRALPPSPENERLQVELLAILCRFVAFAGDTSRAIRLADEVLARLPEDEAALRARAYSALAVAHMMEGRNPEADRAYALCMTLALEAEDYSLAAHASMIKAIWETDHGRLHIAASTYQSIIDLGEQAGQSVFYPAGYGYLGLAGIHLEWNERETAERYLRKGMELCRLGGLAGLSMGHAIRARLLQVEGEYRAAGESLKALGETGVDPQGTARRILLRIEMGDLETAGRLAGPWMMAVDSRRAGPQPPPLIAETIRVTLARLHLARRELEQAGRLLDEVQATAEPAHRLARLIEVHLFRALLHQAENSGTPTAEAVESFERALALAQPEGYVLLFLEQGDTLLPLLRAVIGQVPAGDPVGRYARRLLEACGLQAAAGEAPASAETAGLVEPLTPRELEILQHIAAGKTNQEIAEQLVITVRTVKKHASNIYGKLNVSSRTQAAARARQLGLLASDR